MVHYWDCADATFEITDKLEGQINDRKSWSLVVL